MDIVNRLALRGLCLVAAALALASPQVHAQNFPNKPVRVVLHAGAGSAMDLLARVLGEKLSASWGQQVIVDNRPAAGGIVAAEFVARSAPDGHTLFLSSETPFAVLPSLNPKLPYDPIRDFSPVSLMVRIHYVLVVNSSLPVNSVPELIAYLRANPGKVNYGSPGNGMGHHLGMELFKTMAKVDAVHVPYKTNAAAVTDLVANQVSLMFNSFGIMQPHIKAGKVRPIAVGWSSPVAQLPELPTIAQSGNLPGFELVTWVGLFAPAGTPPDVIGKIQADSSRFLKTQELSDRFIALAFEIVGSTPGELRDVVQKDGQKWGQIVRQSGARMD
jgi:tripartite-type tricarboxylate transporter receptor subunit TctC